MTDDTYESWREICARRYIRFESREGQPVQLISEAFQGASSRTITYGRKMAATVPPHPPPTPHLAEPLPTCALRSERSPRNRRQTRSIRRVQTAYVDHRISVPTARY
jgi:hypothetical protein